MDKAIKQIFKILCKMSDNYEEEKGTILNHPRIIEYLFNKPLLKRDNLSDAIGVTDDSFTPVKLTSVQAEEIDTKMMEAAKSMEYYQDYYEQYQTLSASGRLAGASATWQKIIIKSTPLRLTKKEEYDKLLPIKNILLSPNIEKISKKLDEINIRHVINWTFKHDEEYVSANKIKPYSFDVDLRINFLGLIFVGKKKLIKKMVLFAIEYDESGKEFRISDYLKQYYLRQMNVHLLRLNNKMNLRKEINRFIKEILDSSTYVVMNGLIKTIKNDVSNKLNIFYENYEYNHNLYYKYYDKKKMEGVEDLKEDNRIENYSEKPCDEATVVPAGFLESLMDEKYIFSK